jgi:hypothetical protein
MQESLDVTVPQVNAKMGEALECGSLLPLFPAQPGQLAGRVPVCHAWAGEAANKLAGSKRQQAAAL